MRITKHQLRRIIREAYGGAYDDTAQETRIDKMNLKHDNSRDEYQRGYEDGVEGFPPMPAESKEPEAYMRGWDDGKLDSGYGQMWGGP